MSLVERDQLILTIIFSIIGFILFIFLLCCLCWKMFRSYHLKFKQTNSNVQQSHLPSSHRTQYQRTHKKYLSTKFDRHINHKTKKRQRRSNTNESAITLSFNPPHLINQNVKNLEKFLHNESTLTANSWFYEETLPKKTCHYSNSSNEPLYASSSTVLTSISNSLILPPPPLPIENRNIHFQNELDQVLRVKQPLKHSQSCRQTNDLLPFDYYHSRSSPSTTTETNSSTQNSLELIYTRTNATLLRKTRLAQIRDDTAILY